MQDKSKKNGQQKKKMPINALVANLFGHYEFEEILNSALEQGFLSSSDIIHAADIYNPPSEDDDEASVCIDHIRDDFEAIWENHRDEDKGLNACVDEYFPSLKEVLEVLEDYYRLYDYKGLLDEIEPYKIVDYLETYESDALSWHDQTVEDAAREEAEADYNAEIERIDFDDKQQLLELFENKTPDELWQFLCDLFCCGYYDKERFLAGMKKFKEKLSKAAYNIQTKIIM